MLILKDTSEDPDGINNVLFVKPAKSPPAVAVPSIVWRAEIKMLKSDVNDGNKFRFNIFSQAKSRRNTLLYLVGCSLEVQIRKAN